MAHIQTQITVDVAPEHVWDAVRDFGALHTRLAAGFVVDTQLVGSDRIATFASGAVARERLISLDDNARRLAYAVVDSPLGFTHHHATVQVRPVGETRSQLTWTTDVLPDTVAPLVAQLMDAGAAAMKATLDPPRGPSVHAADEPTLGVMASIDEPVDITVRVIPRAKVDEVAGERAGRLLVRTSAPPVDDKANQAVVRIVAAHLGVAWRDVQVIAGHRSRDKTLRIAPRS